MWRREFLKSLLALAATSMVGTAKGANFSSDWSVDIARNIRYIGSPNGSYTVLQLHYWLIDQVDQMEYPFNMDITDPNPSMRITDEYIELIDGFNIDDHAANHLHGGSIIQGPEGKETIYDSIIAHHSEGYKIQARQGSNILKDTTENQFMVKSKNDGVDEATRKRVDFRCSKRDYVSDFHINGLGRGKNVIVFG